MRAYLVDDEPLALRRLKRMVGATGRAEIVGSNGNPAAAVSEIAHLRPDVVFLDVEMPELSGFEVLARLGDLQPLVIFTTAHERYALDAFKVDSIGYLVKPIAQSELDRAVAKVERLLVADAPRHDLATLAEQVRTMLAPPAEYLARIASRSGDRVEFVGVADVSYFYAKDKLTFAVTIGKHHALDMSIGELEQRLPPRQWIRIHRATLLNVDAVKALHGWFAGKLLVRLKDGTALPVARDRVADVRAKLGLT